MPFTTRSLHFLRDLAHNNKKPWFEGHRDDYEAHIRAPMRALIEEMDVRFARFAAELTGDPKRSMFRIHRDIRFSQDKSPYKTDRKSTRLNSSHLVISYAVFCLK